MALAKANEAIAGGNAKTRGRLRFVDYENETLSLNDDAVKKCELRDGLHGVWTNLDAGVDDVRTMYAQLWRIEHAFRVMKHTLRIRPVFH